MTRRYARRPWPGPRRDSRLSGCAVRPARESVTFLPLGYDLIAAVYKVITEDGTDYFLKIRVGPVHESGLLIPWALAKRGIRNVLAPLPTRSSELWCSCAGSSLVLYPFIAGENAMIAGMNDEQWREFGATLHAVHSSGLAGEFRGRLPTETFALPSAALVWPFWISLIVPSSRM